MLLAFSTSPDPVKNGITPLYYYANWHSNVDTIKILVEGGASINFRDD